MAKKKKLEKKKRKTVRTRNWEDKHEFAFTHDLVKHRRASVKLPEAAEESNPLPVDFEPNGVVISHAKKWAFVELAGEERLCLIDERLKEKDSTLLAPGDRVLVEFENEDAIVRGVAERTTKLCRPGHADARLNEQVFAANIDLLVVVAASMKPPFRVGLVDRYLIAAEVGGVKPVLCVNKMDLVDTPPEALSLYRDLGIPIVLTSCTTGEGIDELRTLLKNKCSVLSGHSGVGKSSLLNVLSPDLSLHTKAVSQATQKGQHTTTASRLYVLEDGIRIIDTPGIRALGVWGVSPEELTYYFPEIAEAAGECRFRNCTHSHEPDCAVREAVENNAISSARYASYLRIRASLESETGMTPGRMMPL